MTDSSNIADTENMTDSSNIADIENMTDSPSQSAPKAYAMIFAGGTGSRMGNSSVPKQFIEYLGKPVIGYTLDKFHEAKSINGIVISCLEPWIPHLKQIITDFNYTKVIDIVAGGSTGQESIYNGVSALAAKVGPASAVLVHDGVRPLINVDTIEACVASVFKNGSTVTVSPAVETVMELSDGGSARLVNRANCRLVRAPQGFVLSELLESHKKARADKLEFIDSASLMDYYGYEMHAIVGPDENIKITTPTDLYAFYGFMGGAQV